MLELKNIRKAYVTAGFTQVALDDVSVAFRDNEFVAVLGASGSGKTTMLNILGGLDHADSGDIVINGISTKDYTDKDWDTYRNHRIGFIFQSYNLIPHQTVLSNVELALTLAGISRAERRERARRALQRVGLGDHVNKRPSQLSGGQMQRVAIARALVNDPDIVLADEPTGALDTETGIQVMDLLKEIANERLVIMVTHNPELAEEYATRIVRLKDGHIVDDSDPVLAVPAGAAASMPHDRRKPARHASMSFLTALALSFNNLMTKKGRTFMTAFAGSIGIIGIAAILALSNGVNGYIADTEEQALSSYPLTITKSSFDLTSMMMASVEADGEGPENNVEAEAQEASATAADQQVIPEYTIMSDMFARVKNNDLARFKTFLESGDSGIEPYVNTIQYTYGVTPLIYSSDTSGGAVRLNPSKMSQTMTNGIVGSSFVGGMTAGAFQELLADQHLLDQQAVVEVGRWPEAYDECVLVTTRGGWLSDYTLYSLGVHNTKDMEDMLTQALNGEDVEVPEITSEFTKEDALKLTFKVVPAVNLYQKSAGQDTWTDMTGDKAFMKKAVDDGITLKVVGIVHRADDATSSSLSEGIAYSPLLTEHLMEIAAKSKIVAEQNARPEVDVFTGKTFEELQNDEQNELDMESIFSVDEEKLQQAFQFDTSAFEGVGQGMDLSGIDLSSAFSGMDLSSMDFSQMDTSALAQLFDGDSLGDLMGSVPAYTGEGMDLSGELTDLDIASKLAPKAAELVNGFATYLAEGLGGEEGTVDVAAMLEAYRQSDTAQGIVQELVDLVAEQYGDGEKAEEARTLINSYLDEQFLPYLQQALADVDLTQLDEAALQQIIAQAPPFGFDELGEALSIEAVTEATAGAANSLAADFAAWLLQNPSYLLGDGEEDPKSYGELVERYLESDSAKGIVDGLMSDLGGEVSDKVISAVNTSLNDYLATVGSSFSGALEAKMSAVTEELGKQLGQVFFAQLSDQMAQASQGAGAAIANQISASMSQMGGSLENAFSVDGDAFAEAIQFNMTQDDLASILSNYMNAEELSYDANLKKLGYARLEDPESISIYPVDFPSKEAVLRIIDTYNERMTAAGEEDASIVYSDFAGVLMGSVTDIVNTVSLVLIAFVSISLVVSSIMISIITYISVLERKKEIGILRAMGASKLNVANIFNAETVIEGFIAGVLAIAVVYAVSVPVNAFILETRSVPNIMQLPWQSALTLVGVSVGLTLIAGLIPSSAAARRDPVEALRSE